MPRRANATTVSDEKIAVWAFVLQNMVTPPAVLYGSWASAGLILAALGQPWVGLGFALVGMAFDEIEVEIAPNVRVRVVRSTVSQVVSKTEPAEA